MQNELKPCPFCGEIPKVHYNEVLEMYTVECENKNCNIVCHTCLAIKKEYAIENWNRRVNNAE
ncbi:MAG: Lar family restriction alleviation protein [Clostridia bacterium]|nr:Lar family restriction alleviation protein [Clostridia bacterium]